jgi:hypothetical protein
VVRLRTSLFSPAIWLEINKCCFEKYS